MNWSSGQILVRTDFPGGSLAVSKIDRTTVRARLRREQLCYADGFAYDYNRHFAFGVENLTDRPQTLLVLVDCDTAEGLPDEPVVLFDAASSQVEFSAADLRARSDASRSYAIWIPLEPGEIRYLANYFFRPFAGLVDLFDRLGREGRASREVIGRSVEGRDLVAYGYARPPMDGARRPAILITSGVHPPEPDTLASEAIMAHLASAGGASLRDDFDIYVAPLMNPDGFVHGYNGCNAREINFYWLFDTDDRDACPEAYFLWRFIERIVPVVYFDWHGYTFQRGEKRAAPYLKPVIFHDSRAVRRLVRAMNRRVAAASGGRATRGFLTYAPSTLAAKLTSRFNTITYAKFHLELRLGLEPNQRLAVEALRAVAETLRAEDFLNPARILKRPYGDVSPDAVATAARRLVTWWGGRARPALGRVRRRVRRVMGAPHQVPAAGLAE